MKLRYLLREKGLGVIKVGTVDDYQGQVCMAIFTDMNSNTNNCQNSNLNNFSMSKIMVSICAFVHSKNTYSDIEDIILIDVLPDLCRKRGLYSYQPYYHVANHFQSRETRTQKS